MRIDAHMVSEGTAESLKGRVLTLIELRKKDLELQLLEVDLETKRLLCLKTGWELRSKQIKVVAQVLGLSTLAGGIGTMLMRWFFG